MIHKRSNKLNHVHKSLTVQRKKCICSEGTLSGQSGKAMWLPVAGLGYPPLTQVQ